MKSKAHFLERVSREMDEDLPALDAPVEEILAAACRIGGLHEDAFTLKPQDLGRAPSDPSRAHPLNVRSGQESCVESAQVVVHVGVRLTEVLLPIARSRGCVLLTTAQR